MKERTQEQVYRIKKITLFVDAFLILLWIGLFFYVFTNIELAKKINNGELNACHVCEERLGARCTLVNYDCTYWVKNASLEREKREWCESQQNNFEINLDNLEINS